MTDIVLSDAMKETLLNRALANLNAVGAQYKIVIGETVIDTFPQNTLRQNGMPRKKREIKHQWSKIVGYRVKVEVMKPGDVLQWKRADYPEMALAYDWGSFVSSVDEAGRRYIGKGNYMLERGDQTVTIMREA